MPSFRRLRCISFLLCSKIKCSNLNLYCQQFVLNLRSLRIATLLQVKHCFLQALSAKAKPKIQFGLLSITKELDREQSLKLILLAFQRILANESV